jgi:hypothetical protein
MSTLPHIESLSLNEATWLEACDAASQRDVTNQTLLEVQRYLASQRRWDGVYMLSVMAGLETSVLIDANDEIFLDWGTQGQVRLQPPVGAKIPFKVWVHTHPRFAAYWSHTDTTSLSLGLRILESAIVLGQPGPKSSENTTMVETSNSQTLSHVGPLAHWTLEDPVPWHVWYEQQGIEVKDE